jgi:hypothetical protein
MCPGIIPSDLAPIENGEEIRQLGNRWGGKGEEGKVGRVHMKEVVRNGLKQEKERIPYMDFRNYKMRCPASRQYCGSIIIQLHIVSIGRAKEENWTSQFGITNLRFNSFP